MNLYFAQFSPAEYKPGEYFVFFPDLEGCNTFGDNLSDALAQAKDCLTGYLKTCARLGEEIASPPPWRKREKRRRPSARRWAWI